jgi:hypothetical protein
VVADARQAAVVAAGEPAGTPVVVVMDDRSGAPTLRAIAYANQVRAALAPQGPIDVRVFLGSPADYLTGRPTITGQQEHDAYSRESMASIRRLTSPPLAMVVRAFDPGAFAHGIALPGSTRAASDVVVLAGSPPVPPAGPERLGAVGGSLQSPWVPAWEALLLLVIAGVVGGPIAVRCPDPRIRPGRRHRPGAVRRGRLGRTGARRPARLGGGPAPPEGYLSPV